MDGIADQDRSRIEDGFEPGDGFVDTFDDRAVHLLFTAEIPDGADSRISAYPNRNAWFGSLALYLWLSVRNRSRPTHYLDALRPWWLLGSDTVGSDW